MLFRCLHPKCQNVSGGPEFEADKPVCPRCGLDGTKPRYARFIEPLCTVHYDPPDESGLPGLGANVMLCNGKTIRELKPHERFTGDPTCVNCKACKAHPQFPKEGEWDPTKGVPDWKVSEKFKELSK